MNAVADLMRDLGELGRYEDVWPTMFARTPVAPVLRVLGGVAPELVRGTLRTLVGTVMGRGDHGASDARLLLEADKVERSYGSTTVRGWPLGRFFLIHDGAHSPGHLCVYDPRHRLVLAGAATIEINPAFLYSSMSGLVAICTDLAMMAREGFVDYVADGHRSPVSNARLIAATGVDAVHPTQRLDLMRGAEESAAFLEFFATYYQRLVEEVRLSHSRIGRASVGDTVEAVRGSADLYVRFKVSLRFPGMPSRLRRPRRSGPPRRRGSAGAGRSADRLRPRGVSLTCR